MTNISSTLYTERHDGAPLLQLCRLPQSRQTVGGDRRRARPSVQGRQDGHHIRRQCKPHRRAQLLTEEETRLQATDGG